MSATDVFEKFLGIEGPTNDPAVLLGLGADAGKEGVVVTALQNRLMQIAAHPDGLSPEADEVRLALHAAAARLLSPARRTSADAAAAPASQPADPHPTPLEAAILLTLATMGGWNPRSRERIGVLAQTYGVPVEHVVSMAEALMGRPVQRPAAASVVAPAAARTQPPARSGPDRFRPPPADPTSIRTNPGLNDEYPVVPDTDPGNRVVRNILIGGGVALFGSAALIVLSVTVMRRDPAPAPAPGETTTAATTPQPKSEELFPIRPREEKVKPAPAQPTNVQRVGDWDDLLRAASAAVTTLGTDTERGLADLEKTYAQMSTRWVETGGDGLVAAVDRLVEFLYRAGAKGNAAERAIDMMVAGTQTLSGTGRVAAEEVLKGAWTAGVLARISREKDLPATLRNKVHDALVTMFPGSSGPGEASFQSGCMAALSVMAARNAQSEAGTADDDLKKSQEAWKAWLTGVAAVAGEESPLYTRQVLLALDSTLTRGPDPLKSRAAFQAITVLTTAVRWRKDDESRRWLLRWFDDDNVTSGDLYAVTAALAGESGAEGVDSSMVVSGGAASGDRTEMRDRFAAMWGMAAGESRDALVQRWIDAVAVQDGAQAQATHDPVFWAEELLQLARYNRAAMLLWAGEVDGVADLLEPITRSQSQSYDPSQRTKIVALDPNAVTTTQWVHDYLAAGQNIPLRREMLARLSGPFDPFISEVLVEEACRGSPMQVRQDAKDKLARYLSTPQVLNALLEFAPLMPITRENAAMVEAATFTQLPALRDPTWRVAVRRALVESLLQVMAGQSPLARIDTISESVASLYAPLDEATAPTSAPSAPEGQRDPDAAPTPPPAETKPAPNLGIDVAAVKQRLRLQREAELLVPTAREPYNLTQMEQRRRARAELANGRIQEFEAEQVSVCELMAYICVAEQPNRAPQAGAILTEMDEQRRKAKTVFQQLAIAERARLRLWTLRFSERKA